jgi:hypothetical protein
MILEAPRRVRARCLQAHGGPRRAQGGGSARRGRRRPHWGGGARRRGRKPGRGSAAWGRPAGRRPPGGAQPRRAPAACAEKLTCGHNLQETARRDRGGGVADERERVRAVPYSARGTFWQRAWLRYDADRVGRPPAGGCVYRSGSCGPAVGAARAAAWAAGARRPRGAALTSWCGGRRRGGAACAGRGRPLAARRGAGSALTPPRALIAALDEACVWWACPPVWRVPALTGCPAGAHACMPWCGHR